MHVIFLETLIIIFRVLAIKEEFSPKNFTIFLDDLFV